MEQALKNSIVETQPTIAQLENIEEMKTFWPTEAEFKQPLVYIDHLIRNHHIWQYGSIKIIPPQSFEPTLAFDIDSSQWLPTRYQVLNEMS